ncbi:unnamed protein product, partial [Aureobasidium vineae]
THHNNVKRRRLGRRRWKERPRQNGRTSSPWEYDPELEGKLDTKPSENRTTFPPRTPIGISLPHFARTNSRWAFLRNPRLLGACTQVWKKSPPTAHYDPFESMPTYSQRYTKKKNTLPKLSSRPFVKSFFPEELWAIIEPGSVAGTEGQRRKVLNLSTRTRLDRFDTELDDDEDADADDAGDEDKVEGEDEDKEEEDPDQFDEDDEDDNDDYNAEQYFDGGDDDEFGGDDGGGDGDDY